jgi:hypothetical protein
MPGSPPRAAGQSWARSSAPRDWRQGTPERPVHNLPRTLGWAEQMGTGEFAVSLARDRGTDRSAPGQKILAVVDESIAR